MIIKRTTTPSLYFFDELFDELFNDIKLTQAKKLPIHDVIENDNEYIVELSLPGISKENVKIDIEKDILTIKAERIENNELKYNRKESYFGKYEKSITLPDSLDIENIVATFINGILEIKIQKIKDENKLGKRMIEIM